MKSQKTIAMMILAALLLGMVFSASAEERLPPPTIMENEDFEYAYIVYGTYEQDNNLENGPEPIEWFVLKEVDGRVLVISRYALELSKYHHTIAVDSSLMWETWDVRAWLNGEFLETAFTEAEQARIPTVTVEAQRNRFSANQGNDTEDKVFLLSYNEAANYLKWAQRRKCKPTAYAIASYEAKHGKEWKSAYFHEVDAENCEWWLRTPGKFPGSATVVLTNGIRAIMGEASLQSSHDDYGVRPAMWIDLEP